MKDLEWIKNCTAKISNAIGGGSELFTRHGDEFRLDVDFVCKRISEMRERYHEAMHRTVKAERSASAKDAEILHLHEEVNRQDAEIARLLEALEAISGYENLSAEEFRKSYPEFAAKIRKTSNDGQRASVICSHAYLALSALQPTNGSTS